MFAELEVGSTKAISYGLDIGGDLLLPAQTFINDLRPFPAQAKNLEA
ncbi:MAG TPA: hypothetical protein VEX43_12600 [Chthoniobacterales bacterium]|nr:hypothetical protein [Chthoniobacterales bacterium]